MPSISRLPSARIRPMWASPPGPAARSRPRIFSTGLTRSTDPPVKIRNIHPSTLLPGAVLTVSCWLLPVAEVPATTPLRVCHGDHYNVVELPFVPTAITSSGMVAGTTEAHRAALWRPHSGLQELRVPEGFRF